jgi:hypothetical protein
VISDEGFVMDYGKHKVSSDGDIHGIIHRPTNF